MTIRFHHCGRHALSRATLLRFRHTDTESGFWLHHPIPSPKRFMANGMLYKKILDANPKVDPIT